MGQPILKTMPTAHPTRLITVDFYPDEQELHQRIREQHIGLREKAKALRASGISGGVPRGDLTKLFNQLRFFSSHPALVEGAAYIPKPKTESTAVVEPQVPETPATTVQYFCRLCCLVLAKPGIARVRLIPQCASPEVLTLT